MALCRLDERRDLMQLSVYWMGQEAQMQIGRLQDAAAWQLDGYTTARQFDAPQECFRRGALTLMGTWH